MALALGSSNRSVVNSQRSYPLWGYRFAPVAIIVIRQEPFVFNGSHLPAMWRARSIEVSAATNDAPLPSFMFVSSLLTMSYSVSSSSSAGGMLRVTAAAAMALRSHAASRFILADMVALVTPAASHRACCSSPSLARCRRTFHAATSRRRSPNSIACVLAVVLPVMSVPFVCVPLELVRTMLWAARLVVQYDRLPGSVWSNWARKNMENESAPHRVGAWCGADRQPWAGFRTIQVTRVPGFALH